MNPVHPVTQTRLSEFLLQVAVRRPVFIWGQPGIGKSALVEKFATQVGMACVSLLGSQLAPEDVIGVPQIVDGTSRFCPPRMIARDEPYCLFLDELNACSNEVQRSFYSLIHERRVGDYTMPAGSVVIGAGNRAQDSAIVRPLSSALINRMVHVHLSVSVRDWLAWALPAQIHPWVFEYIELRPDHLTAKPPGHEEPFSTPRSWHMVSDALREYGDDISEREISTIAFGCLSPHHAGQFRAFVKQRRNGIRITSILRGTERWPEDPADRDLLYFLAQSFRAHLAKELPVDRDQLTAAHKQVAHRAKGLMKELAAISLEMAQLVVTDDGDSAPPPSWFLVELVRDLPRLAEK